MKTKQVLWLETHVSSENEYHRDIPLKGLAKDLIDNDIEFLKELWANWED